MDRNSTYPFMIIATINIFRDKNHNPFGPVMGYNEQYLKLEHTATKPPELSRTSASSFPHF